MKYVKRAALTLATVLALLIPWGLLEPRLIIDQENRSASIPALPSAWQGKRVAVIADLQVGMWLANTGTVRRIVKRLIQERPEVVLIAGDFLYEPGDDPTGQIAQAVGLVRPLTDAGIPTYAVLGNHDYGVYSPGDAVDQQVADQLIRQLEAAGIRVLRNSAVPLPQPAGRSGGVSREPAQLYLAGIGPLRPGQDRWAEALAQAPSGAPRLALMHNPNTFPKLPAGAAPLAVAGHTHGGQVRIPFTPNWSWPKLIKGEDFVADGWIPEDYGKAGNRLYVNRGIGFSLVPIRINCPPEITMFTLQSGGS